MDSSLITDSGLRPTLQLNSFSNEQLIEQIGVMADQALFKGKVDILDDAAKLANRALRILKMVRAALIYLSLVMG